MISSRTKNQHTRNKSEFGLNCGWSHVHNKKCENIEWSSRYQPKNSEKRFYEKFNTKDDKMLLRSPEVLNIRRQVQINDKESLFKAQKKFGFILPADMTKWDYMLSCAANSREG